MITFTVPAQLRAIPRNRLKDFYKAFFDCASAAIKELCSSRLKGECGMIGVLHSHSRQLAFHPHIHFIVPAIVLKREQQSIVRLTKEFFLSGHALAELFRGKFLAELKALKIDFPRFLYGKKWNADCKPKGRGKEVFQYLARYLMRGVVSEKALKRHAGKVELSYRDSNDGSVKKVTFDEVAFLKRLAWHVLPKGFRRVRSYGFLAPAGKKMLQRLQLLLHADLPDEELPPTPVVKCPCCDAAMVLIVHYLNKEQVQKEQRSNPMIRSPPITSKLRQ
tara:strand:- start:71 stop:901 length:831 start_codon:yes stop_codon:yes gene_type:complete